MQAGEVSVAKVVGNDRVGDDDDAGVADVVCSCERCVCGDSSSWRLRSSMAVCKGSAQAESVVASTGSASLD